MAIATKTKKPIHSIHHKKRSGLHQKRGSQFMKTYWPYLPMLGLAAIGLAILGAKVIGPLGAVLGGGSVTVAALLLSL